MEPLDDASSAPRCCEWLASARNPGTVGVFSLSSVPGSEKSKPSFTVDSCAGGKRSPGNLQTHRTDL